MDEQRPAMKSPGFLMYALRFVNMWTMAVVAVVGFTRFLNALLEKGTLFELEFPSWLPIYLIVTGFVQLTLGMVAYIALKELRTWHVPALWIAAVFTIAIAWVERLFLWSPDQQPANNTFTIVLHLAWLLLITFYTIKINKKEPADGPGN